MAGVWAWARADVRRRWGGLVFLALLIGLVGAVVLTALTGARRTATSLDRLVAAVGFRDAVFQGVDPSDLDRLATLPFVERVIPVEQYVGTVKGTDLDVGLYIGTSAWGRDVDRPVLKAGRLPDQDRADEVLANSKMASALGLELGDHLTFHSLAPDELRGYVAGGEAYHGPPGPAPDLVVVGIGDQVDDLLSSRDPALLGTAAFVQTFHDRAGHFGGPDGVGSLGAVWLRGGPRDAEKLTTAIYDLFPRGYEGYAQTSAESRQGTDGALGTLRTAALLFALVTGAAGALALAQALGRHLARSEDEAAVLGSLGLTRRQRSVGLALTIVPALLVGAAIAAGGAVMASPVTPFGLARRLEPNPGLRIDVPVIAIGVLTILGLGVVIAGLVAWRATRASKAAAARPSRVAELASRAGTPPAFAAGLRFSLQNGSNRAGTPARASLLGAALGIAGVVGAIAYGSSLDHLTDHPSQWGWTWDLKFDLAESNATATADSVATQPEVAGTAVFMSWFVNLGPLGQQARAIDVRSGSMMVPTRAGRLPASPDEVALGVRLAAHLGVSVGDTLTVDAPDGAHQLTVVGIANLYPDDGGAMGDGVILTPAGLEAAATAQDPPQLLVDLKPGLDPRTVGEALAQRYPDELGVSAYSFPRPPPEVANVAAIRSVPWALAAFFAVLALAGVGHAVVTSTRRRNGDLAVLRALGFRPRQAATAVHAHAAALSAIGLLVGVIVGPIIGRWAWSVLATDVGIEGGFLVRIGRLGMALILVMLVMQVVAMIPAHRAARAKPAELLRTE
jgi:putative ABC transport system permease protein